MNLPTERQVRESINTYSLDAGLSDSDIKRFLDNIFIYESVDSTNDVAKEFALANPGIEAVFIAGSQTKGRGRRGRSFYSPENTGIYMSFLLYPQSNFSAFVKITCMTAVAICRAIKNTTGIDTTIKWVNDIFLNNLKIGGILTEGISCIEDSELSHIIVGLGINLCTPYDGFPSEIRKTAGALLKGGADDKLKGSLIGAIIVEFTSLLNSLSLNTFVDEYRNRSMLIGSYVKINEFKENEKTSKGYALVKEIDDDCRLIIEYDDGTDSALSSGEVSVVKY